MANKRQRKKNGKKIDTRKIRINQKDKQLFDRLTRNARNKIRRVEKNYGINLSDDIDLKLISDFKTRNDFNQWIEDIQSFTNRNNTTYQFVKNEHGLVISKKELNNIIKTSKQNQKRAIEARDKALGLKGLNRKQRELKQLSDNVKMLGEANATGITIPAIFNFKQFRTRSTLNKAIENVFKRDNPDYFDERAERMKDNFIRSLQGSFNSEADYLITLLEQMNGQDFYEMYMDDELLNFDFSLYDSEGSFYEADMGKLQAMLQKVRDWNNGVTDRDFMGFPNR